MGLGIKLAGGGGGGGAPSVVKVANAAARLLLPTADGLLALQLDNNILYEYDTTSASWLILADPAQVGFYRVANAAALAALTPIDGSYAHQLDTDELYQYDLGTTTWQLMAAFARRGVYRPANAAALAAIPPLDGDIAVQLDTNVVYQYDLGTTSWIIVSDPLAPGVRKVADAAALAALTGMTDGDMVIQLDTDEVYEYNFATTDWLKVGGAGGFGHYSGYHQTTGEVIDVPGVAFIENATQYFASYYNHLLVAGLTEMRLGGTIDSAINGQAASDMSGFQLRSNIGNILATNITRVYPFAFQSQFGANATVGESLAFTDSSSYLAGASVPTIRSFYTYPVINQATMNQHNGFVSAFTVGSTSATHIDTSVVFAAYDQFQANADIDFAAGVSIRQAFQTGAVVDGYAYIDCNTQFDVVGLNGYRGIELGGNFGQNSVTTVNNHIDFQSHPAYQVNATLGSYQGLSTGPSFVEGSSLGFATGWYMNMDLRGTVTGGVAGIATNNNLGNGTAPVAMTSYQDMNLNPNFGANLTLTDYQGFTIRPNVQAGATITNSVNMINVGVNSALPVGGSATGIYVDMSNFQTPAAPTGISVQNGGSALFALFDTGLFPVQSTGGPYGLNYLGGTLHIAAGSPITGGNFGIGNNLGIAVFAEDDIPVDASGLRLGFMMNGFLTQIGVAAGKTVDSLSFMAAGAQDAVPGGANGTIDEVMMFRALGILPTNGVVINNIYGFKVESVLTAAGPGSAWGFFCDDANADNYFAKSIAVATATKKAANVDVGIEIGGTKTLLHGRLTTAQRNAIAAPLAGMEIYNTTENQLERYDGVTWEAVGARLVVQTDLAVTDAVDFVPANKRRQVHQIHGNGGEATPTDIDITLAQEGDELLFIGTDNDNTVTFNSAANTVLNGSCTLAADDTLTLIFVNGKYREFGRNN